VREYLDNQVTIENEPGIVVINANHLRSLSGDSEPGVAIPGGRRMLLRDNAYLFPGSPLYNAAMFPVADHVDKHFGHEMGHALGDLRHTCNNQNLMSNRRLDPSGDKRVDNIHLSTSIAQVTSPGGDGKDCGSGNDQIINPGADDVTAVVNQIQLLRNAAKATPGCKIAGTNTDCTMRSDIHTDRIREVPVAFTDLSTVTATNLSETVKLFHEPMGPLDRATFASVDSFDYYTFIDQDQNEGTGGKAEDLGVTISFRGAEFATRLRVTLVSGQRFLFRPTVWRFTAGAFVIVSDPRITAYAFPLIASSERGTAHLTDQVTIELPNSIFGSAINNFRLQAAVVSNSGGNAAVLDILDDGSERPGKLYRWRSPTFPVCSVVPGASPRGGLIVVKSTGLLPNRPVHLIFGDRHIANGNAAADGSVSISTAIPADARGGEHLITVGTDGTALTADCTTTVITEDQPPGGRCSSCQAETRYSLSFFGGATFPHGAFNTIADSSYSLGIKPAFHFPAFGGDASLGFYFGRDNFTNPAPGGDFHLTHFSPEFEFAPTRRICPIPSLHIGAGAYRNENGNYAFGFNVGAGLSVCLNRRFSLLWRYDYRSVNDFSRNYSTVQGGVRFHF